MLAAIAFAAALQATTTFPEACAHDRAALLALSHEDFDQDLEGGWRPLAEKEECREVAADLLADYRETHWGELTVADVHTNYWHEGQLRASLGQVDQAVRLLMAGVNPSVDGDGFEDYAVGTIAFLLNDREALQAARDRLAATPAPPHFAAGAERFRARYGRELVWPMNLDVLDKLIACFGQGYDKAYGDCRPE